MEDNNGRKIDYIRISVTDRCNLRCVYCMPEEGITLFSHKDVLTFAETGRIVVQMAGLGIKKIKLTGGEPLVRKGLPDLAGAIKNIPGIEEVTLTTNGVELETYAQSLVSAGIDAINISLDTLDRKRYMELTRRDALESVLRGIAAMGQYPHIRLKINCVPVGTAEDILCVAGMAREKDIHVRFIELMPVGLGMGAGAVNEAGIMELLAKEYGTLVPCRQRLGNGPAKYYSIEGFKGRIGFISAISHKFCDRCNRVRLTADGFLKACLQYDSGTDLRKLIRGGCTDPELRMACAAVIAAKPEGHTFGTTARDTCGRDERMMSQIGG